MNILVVHNLYKYRGGEESVVNNEIDILTKHGNNVFSYFRDNREIEDMNIIEKIKSAFSVIFSFRTYREVNKIIKDKKINVVHVHNVIPLISFSVYYAAKKNNCRLIQSLHNFRLLCPCALLARDNKPCDECIEKGLLSSIKYKCYRNSYIQTSFVAISLWLHRKIGTFNKVDKYIETTEFNINMLSKIINKDKFVIRPYFYSSSFNTKSNKSRDYYIYISRIENSKGIDLIIKAFETMPNLKLLIVGSGSDEQLYREYVTNHRLNNIEFAGFKKKEEVIELLYNAKAMILPTKLYEGFPMTIVESLFVATPIIGSDYGNVGSIIKEGINGLKFKYNDYEDLKKVIQMFDNDEGLQRKLEIGAKNDYVNNHSEDLLYTSTMNIYQNNK